MKTNYGSEDFSYRSIEIIGVHVSFPGRGVDEYVN